MLQVLDKSNTNLCMELHLGNTSAQPHPPTQRRRKLHQAYYTLILFLLKNSMDKDTETNSVEILFVSPSVQVHRCIGGRRNKGDHM